MNVAHAHFLSSRPERAATGCPSAPGTPEQSGRRHLRAAGKQALIGPAADRLLKTTLHPFHMDYMWMYTFLSCVDPYKSDKFEQMLTN